MAENKLVLHPRDPWAILQDPSLLLDAVRERGLTGASFGHFGELHYREGPRFRELVAFEAAPAPAAAFHVSLLETTAEAAFLGGANVLPPQCPACRGQLSDWRAQLSEWQLDRHGWGWRCRGCGLRLRVEQLDWLRRAGVARYALDLWGVRENEAKPSPELLDVLRGVSEEDWTWFYYRL